MKIEAHKDKCGYWFKWKRENRIVSVSLVELVEAYENRRIRKGRWKGAGIGGYICSWCGEYVEEQYTYCPYCGIPMTKEMDEAKSDFDCIIDLQPTIDIDAITKAHADIGYEQGYRDGYAEVVSGNRYHYCPNCGARMDGEENEE